MKCLLIVRTWKLVEEMIENDNPGRLGDLEELFTELFKMKGLTSLAFHLVATRDEEGEYVEWYLR